MCALIKAVKGKCLRAIKKSHTRKAWAYDKNILCNRIPTPALPGSGSRDRTALCLISAGLRQRPLDYACSIAWEKQVVKQQISGKSKDPLGVLGIFAPV